MEFFYDLKTKVPEELKVWVSVELAWAWQLYLWYWFQALCSGLSQSPRGCFGEIGCGPSDSEWL